MAYLRHETGRISQLARLAQQAQPLVAGVRYHFAHADVAPLADAYPFPRARGVAVRRPRMLNETAPPGDEPRRVASRQYAPATPYLPRLNSEEASTHDRVNLNVMRAMAYLRHQTGCYGEQVAVAEGNWKQVLAQIGIAQKMYLSATVHSAP